MEKKGGTVEDRRHTRHEIEVGVVWRRESGENVELCTENVSESGALLRMGEAAPPGAQMALTFLLPERVIKAQARVCYLGRFDEGAQVGVQFGEMSVEARTHWQKWCASLTPTVEATARGDAARSEACVLALASALPSDALASLVDSGCRVSLANDAAAALRMLSKGQTDVLISDVRRPDLDGRALCELVRRNRSFGGVHVILLMGQGEAADPARGLDVGATYVFTQPVDPEELISVIALCQRS